jgi:osmoprotectant transport system ATP-binding protein
MAESGGQAGVQFAQVSYRLRDGRLLLDDISLDCKRGSVTALLGRSGSGKTTLLRTVNGLVRPTSGSVRLGAQEIGTLGSEALLAVRRRVGYCIQETGLFPHMTVGTNIGLSLELARVNANERSQRVAEAMQRAGLPEELAARYPWQLSGGQRQRAGLARALVIRPEVLLMDEPFGALDPITRAEMQQMLKDLLAASSMTVLIVTHYLEEALFLADCVIFLEGGRKVEELAAGDVIRSPNPAVQQYVQAVRRTGVQAVRQNGVESAHA